MPILDIGYRAWQGPRSPAWTRALVVASTGIRLVWNSNWIKRILLLLTFPSVVTAILVGAFEQTQQDAATRESVRFIERSSGARAVIESSGTSVKELREDPSAMRHFTWSYLLFTLYRYPQAFGMILIIGLVGPRLISYDLRSRGYLLYLSRPLSPGEYLLGKAGVLYTILLGVATVPALSIYVLGLFVSTDSWAIAHTWDIPLRILGASVLLILPTSAIALALSSLTQESRYAGFAWFAIWLLGHVAYSVLYSAQNFVEASRSGRIVTEAYSSLMYLSPYELLGYLQKRAFGLLPADAPIVIPLLALIAITVVGYAVAYWRVSRILKI